MFSVILYERGERSRLRWNCAERGKKGYTSASDCSLIISILELIPLSQDPQSSHFVF